MIRCRPTALVVFVFLLFGMAACETGPKAKSHSVANLDAQKKRTTVTLRVEEEVKLKLPASDASGYRWQLFSHDSRFLRQMSEITPPSAAEGSWTVSFLALRATQRTLVRFLLVKENAEKEAQPIDSQDVTVVIEL